MQLFERAGFNLERTRTVGDRETRYYYLDLYHSDAEAQRRRGDA